MGRYQSIYTGPVLIGEYKIVEEIERYPQCQNPRCAAKNKRAPKSTPFCSQCGEPMGQGAATKVRPSVDWEDAANAFITAGSNEDVLTLMEQEWCPEIPEGCHVFLVNDHKGRKPPQRLHSDSDSACIFPGNSAEAVRWFQETYEKEITNLQQLYEKVEVKWAVLVYWA